MLGKLIKYDLKWVFKVLVVFYILTMVFALLGRGFSLIDNSSIFDFVSKISIGTAISLSISGLINNIMRLWARFVVNVYKDESYLTHTLPVKKRDIYLAKVFSGLITMSVSFIVALINLVICYSWDTLCDFVKMIVPGDFTVIIVLGLIVIALEILFLLFLGYLGIIIGHRYNDNKIVTSIICSFGIYMGCSFGVLVILLILGLFNNDIMQLFTSSNMVMDAGFLKFILIIALVIYLIYIILCNIVANRLFSKGVNVE